MSTECCKGCWTRPCEGKCGKYLCPTSGHGEMYGWGYCWYCYEKLEHEEEKEELQNKVKKYLSNIADIEKRLRELDSDAKYTKAELFELLGIAPQCQHDVKENDKYEECAMCSKCGIKLCIEKDCYNEVYKYLDDWDNKLHESRHCLDH